MAYKVEREDDVIFSKLTRVLCYCAHKSVQKFAAVCCLFLIRLLYLCGISIHNCLIVKHYKTMKKYLSLLLTVGVMSWITSCTQETLEPRPKAEMNAGTTKAESHSPIVVTLPTKSLKWDESYHPNGDKFRASNQNEYLNESTEMVVTDPRCFLGKVYFADKIRTLEFATLLDIPLKPITATFMFPGYYTETFAPNASTMAKALQNAVNNPYFSGEQSASFEYDYRAFSHYNELKLAFGADVNVSKVLGINVDVKHNRVQRKTGMCIRLLQRYFTVVADYPEDGNIFTTEAGLQKALPRDPVYVGTVSFGRMAIIAIESEADYKDLQAAFKAAVTAKVVNGTLSVDAKSKAILDESEMHLLVSGGMANDVAKIVKGPSELYNFIKNGANFTRSTHGVPISFTGAYASDHSIFKVFFKASGE